MNVLALGITASPSVAQTLPATLQPNTTYTLRFYVGARSDDVFSGYRVELLAGPSTLASDSSLVPASGTFLAGQIIYDSSSASPALLGQKLGIRILGSANGSAHFDKISLDATPTVLSSTASQIASGGGWKTTLTIVSFSATQQSIKVAFGGMTDSP